MMGSCFSLTFSYTASCAAAKHFPLVNVAMLCFLDENSFHGAQESRSRRKETEA